MCVDYSLLGEHAKGLPNCLINMRLALGLGSMLGLRIMQNNVCNVGLMCACHM
jgi:hypothetical protein